MLNAELRAFIPELGEKAVSRSCGADAADNAGSFPCSECVGHIQSIRKAAIEFRPLMSLLSRGLSLFTGTDPLTGQQVVGQSTWVTSVNNQFLVGDTPVFYLPKVSGPAEDPGDSICRATHTTASLVSR